jgi:hypothetical protein
VSWRAHDGGQQRGTACPFLYRYRLTHTYCSLARLPPTHPFVGAPILQRHFQVLWRARLPPPRVLLPHTCTQDGWFLQPKRRTARLPRRTVPSNCICKCSRMRARLPLHITHTPHPHTSFPMSAHLSRLRLFQRHLRSLVWVWVRVWDWIHSHTPPRTRSPSSRHPPFTH